MTSDLILESFLDLEKQEKRGKKAPATATGTTAATSEVVAVFFANKYGPGADRSVVISYLDEAGLRQLLTATKKPEGVLQRFIEPLGGSQCILQAMWTPRLFLLEQRTNIHKLGDKKLPLAQRCVTYEGAEFQSTTAGQISATTNEGLRRVCTAIARHLYYSSLGPLVVRLMTLHFKIGRDNRLYLLWAPQLRLALAQIPDRGGELVGAGTTATDLSGGTALASGTRMVPCPSCQEVKDSSNMYPVSYKSIMRYKGQYGEDNLSDNNSEVVVLEATEAKGARLSQLPRAGQQASGAPGAAVRGGSALRAGGGARVGGVQSQASMLSGGEDEDDDGSSLTDLRSSSGTSTEPVTIPPILARAVPTLSVHRYGIDRHTIEFQYRTVRLCEDCTLKINNAILKEIEAPPPSILKAKTVKEEAALTMREHLAKAQAQQQQQQLLLQQQQVRHQHQQQQQQQQLAQTQPAEQQGLPPQPQQALAAKAPDAHLKRAVKRGNLHEPPAYKMPIDNIVDPGAKASKKEEPVWAALPRVKQAPRPDGLVTSLDLLEGTTAEEHKDFLLRQMERFRGRGVEGPLLVELDRILDRRPANGQPGAETAGAGDFGGEDDEGRAEHSIQTTRQAIMNPEVLEIFSAQERDILASVIASSSK